MDHDELAVRIEKRLDRIETKLDEFQQSATINQIDLVWLKGHAKISVTFIITIVTGLVLAMVKKNII